MSAASIRHTALLGAVSPFELSAGLRALAGFAPAAGEQQITGDTVRKAFALPDPERAGRPGPERAVVAEVGPRPDGRAGVALAVWSDRPLGAADGTAVERAVSDWLGLTDDLTGFLELARDDPAMAPVLADTAGLHQVRFPSLAEGACYFVLTQRTSQRVAGIRKRRLAAAHGPRLTVDGTEFTAFPTLDRLAGLGQDELARFAGNPQQTEYLGTVIHGLAALDEEWLRTAPYDEAFAALRRLHGVGDYTASAILLRALGRPDRIPLVMPLFTELIDRLYGGAVRPADIAARYGRHQGWWSYFTRTALGHPGPRAA
jgi:3-methyladenine DNA glycosylase/8-oxoguanine DNA glycosylase